MLFALLPLRRLHLLFLSRLHLSLLLSFLLLFLWLASEDPLQAGHSCLRPKDDAALGERSVGHCAGDGLANLAAFWLALVVFLFDDRSFLIELHVFYSHAETVVIPRVSRTDLLWLLGRRRPSSIGMELQRTLLLKVLNIRSILDWLLAEPIVRQFDWRLVEFLIVERIINELFMRILGGIAVLVDEIDEVGALCELLQERVERMMMGAYESLHCVVLSVVELSPRLLDVQTRLSSWSLLPLRVETAVILKEKEHGFEENVLDVLCTKDFLILFLVDPEEKVLLLKVEHLTDVVLWIDLVLPQPLHYFFQVVDVLYRQGSVAGDDLVAVQEDYRSLR